VESKHQQTLRKQKKQINPTPIANSKC